MTLRVAYVARCECCGIARKTYNDPRRGISRIECKGACGSSHYRWRFIKEIPEKEPWPPSSNPPGGDPDVPYYVPPTELRRDSGALSSLPSGAVRVDEGGGHSTTTDPEPPATWSKLEFASEGQSSVPRSGSASPGVDQPLDAPPNVPVFHHRPRKSSALQSSSSCSVQ